MGGSMAIRRDPLDRDRWARLRFAIIGPLLAAPAARRVLHSGAGREDLAPSGHGLQVHFGVSTIERWHYAARRQPDPVTALRNRVRRDIGSRLPSQAVIEDLGAQYREHPGWTAQLHFDNLRALIKTACHCRRTPRSGAI